MFGDTTAAQLRVTDEFVKRAMRNELNRTMPEYFFKGALYIAVNNLPSGLVSVDIHIADEDGTKLMEITNGYEIYEGCTLHMKDLEAYFPFKVGSSKNDPEK